MPEYLNYAPYVAMVTCSDCEAGSRLDENNSNRGIAFLLSALQVKHGTKHNKLTDEDNRVEYLRDDEPPFIELILH